MTSVLEEHRQSVEMEYSCIHRKVRLYRNVNNNVDGCSGNPSSA